MVELNQSCPCKSGSKYRDCCLPLKGLPEFLVTSGMCNEFTIYAERYTLNTLLKKSKEFKAYFISERSKIAKPVIWGVDPTLSASMRTGEIQGLLNLIIVKKSPISLDDAFDAAHELRHLFLAQQGFPKASITDLGLKIEFDTTFATILLNSIMDPLVNSGLTQFGFDLWSYFDKASREQRIVKERGLKEPLQNKDRYLEVLFYIQKALDFELANTQSSRLSDDFMDWYKMMYPNTVREATEIINEIESLGFDTPDKARLILTKIVNQFNLNNIIIIS
ncbi:MAG: SEC-C domain-containing protein [Desulfosporosinus sp.]|nr:SEC-C domain-containing protein [Desulfosporosinus sp.]